MLDYIAYGIVVVICLIGLVGLCMIYSDVLSIPVVVLCVVGGIMGSAYLTIVDMKARKRDRIP